MNSPAGFLPDRDHCENLLHARPDEAGVILDLIKQLAFYERCENDVVADEATLRRSVKYFIITSKNQSAFEYPFYFHYISTMIDLNRTIS